MVHAMAATLMILSIMHIHCTCAGTACSSRAACSEAGAGGGTASSSSKPTLDQYIADARKRAEELKEKSKCPVCAV